MGRDEAFAEYVEQRWSLLYRLAVVLVGEEHAEALTRRALLAAYADWPRVEEALSRDGYVKQLLVRAATEDGSTRHGVDPGAVSQAVLVLRWYEGLSDAEIVETLGDAAPVALDVPGGPDLAEDLRRRAEEPLPPLPPVDALIAHGRRAQARRARRTVAITGAVVAAVVGVFALGAALDPTGSADRPSVLPEPVSVLRLSDLPHGGPPRVAYVAGRDVELGRAEVHLPVPPARLVQAGKVVLVGYPDGRIERLDPRTRARTVLTRSSDGLPVTDPDGRWVAWRRDTDGPVVVVVTSLADGSRQEQVFPTASTCCDDSFRIAGITRSGQVVASAPTAGRTWTWDLQNPGPFAVRHVESLDGLFVAQVVGDEIVVDDPVSVGTGTTVGVVLDNVFEPTGTSDVPGSDYSVPGWVLFAADDGTLHARLRDTGPAEKNGAGRARDVVLRLPPDLDLLGLRFEHDTTVVMDVQTYRSTGSGGFLVRCDVASGACEYLTRLDLDHQLASAGDRG